MHPENRLLPDLTSVLSPNSTDPVVLIRRQDSEAVHVYTGSVSTATSVNQIPLLAEDVIAALPYHQIRERGFDALLDDAQLLYLESDLSWEVPLPKLLQLLPHESLDVEDLGFDTSDAEYARVVERIIDDEIGSGSGANFVIRRDYRAKVDGSARLAALVWLRALLQGEQGAYWTFAFITDQVCLVGASPERHVSAREGTVRMNPISGTFRHGGSRSSESQLVTFIEDRKESEELVMVVDEELKMMSAVCPGGGVMTGPFLKPMSRVTHTEYLLEGTSNLDVREVLRLTMFAPTVTGSPMGSACSVIAQYEPSGRGYYSGVLAHFHRGQRGYELDAPIMIRTAEISPEGDVKVSAGATLVRRSTPEGEALETRVKASGVLTAMGLLEKPVTSGGTHHAQISETPAVQQALEERNRDLAPFWRDQQGAQDPIVQEPTRVVVLDCGDDFSGMLAHQLRHMGLTVAVQPWNLTLRVEEPDLVIFGPGPGDPTDAGDPKVQRVSELIEARLASGKPMITTAFSHQLLAGLAGLPLEALSTPRQGEPVKTELFGEPSLIGFYNTFAAKGKDGALTPHLDLEIQAEPDTDIVYALGRPGVASVQGHLESVLSLDGFDALRRITRAVLSGQPG